MLRAILSAIGRGIRNAFGFAWSMFIWPFTLFIPRRRASPMPDLAVLKQQLQPPVEKPSSAQTLNLRNDRVKDSVIAWSWANGCINDRQTRPMPSAMSRTMATWLQGLNYTQLLKLKNAGPQGVLAHAAGENAIAGIPPRGPLPAIEVRYPPAPVDLTSPRMIRKIA